MIIIKYLVKKIFKNQLSIFFILFLIFFCQKFIKILNAAVNGEFPINLMLSFLLLGIPEIAQLILPLSLFLSLLVTLGTLYIKNEITVMFACGLGRNVLIKSAMILATFTGILSLINMMWVSPWSFFYQEKLLLEIKKNPNISTLVQKQFQQTYKDNLVFFAEKINGNCLYGIFLAQLHSENNIYPSILVAKSGQIIQYKDGSLVIILNEGTRFEEKREIIRNFRITSFRNYQAIIKRHSIILNSGNSERMSIYELWNTNTRGARAELHWRTTLIFTVFMMALIVVPLSVTDSRRKKKPLILPAILLYFVFLLLQTSIKSNAKKGEIEPVIWVWLVNGIYFLLAIILNLNDTVLSRRIRSWFIH